MTYSMLVQSSATCHKNIYDSWSTTAHASAWQTLVEQSREMDPVVFLVIVLVEDLRMDLKDRVRLDIWKMSVVKVVMVQVNNMYRFQPKIPLRSWCQIPFVPLVTMEYRIMVSLNPPPIDSGFSMTNSESSSLPQPSHVDAYWVLKQVVMKRNASVVFKGDCVRCDLVSAGPSTIWWCCS